ncbi:hypothetical protein [Kalamiella sp. sgz302252]|uniref:hypothetical protein n=1 Tax=Pantoea sp. sgz302252 TaxID=3341827 RepID=UPI0036D42D48
MDPTPEEVIAFVREFSGWRKKKIDENTLLEDDLHITGDDGVELLEEAEKVFGISFETEEESFRSLFSLQDNEYLFNSEGFDFFCIGYFYRRLKGIPHPVVRDLSVGKLHEVLIKLRGKENALGKDLLD